MRKKTKRKIWPRINTIAYAIEGAAVADKQSLDVLRHVELSSIEAFRTGCANAHDWMELHSLCLLTSDLASVGIGPEAMATAEAAETELFACYDRYLNSKRLLLTGPGLQLMRDLYEYHDLQRQSISRSEYERAIKRASARAPKEKFWYPESL